MLIRSIIVNYMVIFKVIHLCNYKFMGQVTSKGMYVASCSYLLTLAWPQVCQLCMILWVEREPVVRKKICTNLNRVKQLCFFFIFFYHSTFVLNIIKKKGYQYFRGCFEHKYRKWYQYFRGNGSYMNIITEMNTSI